MGYVPGCGSIPTPASRKPSGARERESSTARLMRQDEGELTEGTHTVSIQDYVAVSVVSLMVLTCVAGVIDFIVGIIVDAFTSWGD